MSTTIAAVYRDGAFHPDTPPDLPEGTAVRLAVIAKPAVLPRSPGRAAFEMIRALAELPEQAGGDPRVTSENHDEILYGGSGGAR